MFASLRLVRGCKTTARHKRTGNGDDEEFDDHHDEEERDGCFYVRWKTTWNETNPEVNFPSISR
jgi:hypothetical protein